MHALWFYRIAHKLYLLKIPVIPRLIFQLARLLTGIEISPGAKIKGSIFIDHENRGRYRFDSRGWGQCRDIFRCRIGQ